MHLTMLYMLALRPPKEFIRWLVGNARALEHHEACPIPHGFRTAGRQHASET